MSTSLTIALGGFPESYTTDLEIRGIRLLHIQCERASLYRYDNNIDQLMSCFQKNTGISLGGKMFQNRRWLFGHCWLLSKHGIE